MDQVNTRMMRHNCRRYVADDYRRIDDPFRSLFRINNRGIRKHSHGKEEQMGVGESKGQGHPIQYHPLGRLGHLLGRFRPNVVSDQIRGRIR